MGFGQLTANEMTSETHPHPDLPLEGEEEKAGYATRQKYLQEQHLKMLLTRSIYPANARPIKIFCISEVPS